LSRRLRAVHREPEALAVDGDETSLLDVRAFTERDVIDGAGDARRDLHVLERVDVRRRDDEVELLSSRPEEIDREDGPLASPPPPCLLVSAVACSGFCKRCSRAQKRNEHEYEHERPRTRDPDDDVSFHNPPRSERDQGESRRSR